jgi:hypothetical protein
MNIERRQFSAELRCCQQDPWQAAGLLDDPALDAEVYAVLPDVMREELTGGRIVQRRHR